MDSPVDAPSDTRLLREHARLLLVCGRELQIFGPRGARLQELDLDLADATADLEDGGALDATLSQEVSHLPRGLVQPALPVFLGEAPGEPPAEEAVVIARATTTRHVASVALSARSQSRDPNTRERCVGRAVGHFHPAMSLPSGLRAS